MLDLGLQGKKETPSAGGIARETDTARFEADVLKVSLTKPVIVDFWAPWCGPCRQLMPLLEKTVAAAGGAVDLVKVNIDENPDLAAALRIQSVPTVYAFFQGQPVDGFMGARPESELKAFVDKLAKLSGTALPQAPEAVSTENAAKLMADADKFFREGRTADAMSAYSTVLDIAPDNMEALAGIGWSLVAEKDMESAAALLADLTPEQKSFSRLQGLQFLQDCAGLAAALAAEEALADKIASNPKDLQSRHDLALRKIAVADLEGAIGALVDLIRLDRDWQEQKARKLLLGLFEAMGSSHPLTGPGRRRLSSVLFS